MNTAAYTEQEALGLALAGTAIFTTLLLLAVVLYLVSALGWWRMFKKAGVPGWKAFVPFVNIYEMYKLSWVGKKFWGWLCFSVISAALFYCAEMLAGGTALDFLPDVLAIAASVVALDYSLKMNVLLAKAYGKGRVFGAFLWAFPFIASLILGFGRAKYLGNQSAV